MSKEKRDRITIQRMDNALILVDDIDDIVPPRHGWASANFRQC
jgi:hypothetical protein